MATTLPRPDPSSPSSIVSATFSSARKGFDPTEVRSFLGAVARELAEARAEVDRLRAEVDAGRAAASGVLDEASAMSLLGVEAARVLRTAREGAASVQARSEEGAARLLREAQDDASRVRHEVELHVLQQRQEAADAAEAERDAAAVAASRQRADAAAEAERVRTEARAEVEAEVAAAKEQAREMLAETRGVRERMLSDLARRREAGLQRLELMDSARERIKAAFEQARQALDEALDGVDRAFLVEADRPGEVVVSIVAGELAAPEIRDPEDAVASPAAVVDLPDLAPAPAATVDEAVDDLFARLRATHTDDVAAQVQAIPTSAAGDATEQSEVEPVLDAWAERAAALEPCTTGLARSLRRALADEQNDVLDRLRRHTKPITLEALVGAVDEHAARYRGAAREHLVQAATVGALALGGGEVGGAVVEASLDAVTGDVVLPLRERLARSLDQADDDTVEAAGLLRAGYREWKTQRLDALAADLVHVAAGRGALAAVSAGTPLCWLVDPASPPCPDADDNALAGRVPAGESFPTGHLSPPAHPGCRCRIARADG